MPDHEGWIHTGNSTHVSATLAPPPQLRRRRGLTAPRVGLAAVLVGLAGIVAGVGMGGPVHRWEVHAWAGASAVLAVCLYRSRAQLATARADLADHRGRLEAAQRLYRQMDAELAVLEAMRPHP